MPSDWDVRRDTRFRINRDECFCSIEPRRFFYKVLKDEWVWSFTLNIGKATGFWTHTQTVLTDNFYFLLRVTYCSVTPYRVCQKFSTFIRAVFFFCEHTLRPY